MDIFSAVFFVLIGLILLLVCIWTLKNGITPMPTSTKIKHIVLQNLPEHLEGTIVDLGSAWGTLCFPLAKRYPHCQVIGYETSPIPYMVSRLVQLFVKRKNLTFKRKDFFKEPLSKVTLAICYLYPTAMEKLKDKLEKEGRVFVVSHTFRIPGWTPTKTIQVSDLYHTKIYFYAA
jgi:hypothetical protein